jgi:phosphoenolpyruvate phosphomutase
MKHTAETILESGRSKEVDDEIISIKEVLSIIPGGKA